MKLRKCIFRQESTGTHAGHEELTLPEPSVRELSLRHRIASHVHGPERNHRDLLVVATSPGQRKGCRVDKRLSGDEGRKVSGKELR